MCTRCESASTEVSRYMATLKDRETALVSGHVTPFPVVAASRVLTSEVGSEEWFASIDDMIDVFDHVPHGLPGGQYKAIAEALVLSHKIGQSYLN